MPRASTLANVVKGAGEKSRSGTKSEMILSAGGTESTAGNVLLVLLASVLMYMVFVILLPAVRCRK